MKIIAVTETYQKALCNLPKALTKQANNALAKFYTNPETNGSNSESIHNKFSCNVRSIRVNDDYRTILYVDKENQVTFIVYVDKHDEAYAWADDRKFFNSGKRLMIYVPSEEKKMETKPTYLFSNYTDDQLKKILVPEDQLSLIRGIKDKEDYQNKKIYFSGDTIDLLDLLVEGTPYYEVEKLVDDDTDTTVVPKKTPTLPHGVFLISDDSDLEHIADLSLEQWRVFLHPAQRALVSHDFSGPYRVTGEAGTGKTVVAMHRAKYLVQKDKRVLFTTFTDNLVKDLSNNLKKLLDFSEIPNVTIQSVDKTILKYLISKGVTYYPIYEPSVLEGIWDEAIKKTNTNLGFDAYFYEEEWRKVVSVMDELSLQAYLSVNRQGRGVRLNRLDRIKVWQVMQAYIHQMNQSEDHRADIDFITYKARVLLKNDTYHPYDSIIIDEGQDISANAYKFLRAYVGEEHENDLFIAGDIHQRIYRNKAVLKNCGINIRGRSSVLRVNYRTTEETRKYAMSILNNMDIHDPDSEKVDTIQSSSKVHGENPVQKCFTTLPEEMNYLISEIRSLKDNGTELKDICVIARDHKTLDACKAFFDRDSIPHFEITRDNKDSSDELGVRLSTMHRVKGLEFRFIFVISVNQDIIPRTYNHFDKEDNIDNENIEKCLLYVALTRAQCRAYVLSFGKPSSLLPKETGKRS